VVGGRKYDVECDGVRWGPIGSRWGPDWVRWGPIGSRWGPMGSDWVPLGPMGSDWVISHTDLHNESNTVAYKTSKCTATRTVDNINTHTIFASTKRKYT